MSTVSMENYIKAIFTLQEQSETVTTTALAAQLGVAPASVTGMVKKLARLNLARHSPYQGVELTPAGAKIALEVIRHHRLIELFLAQALGVPWDRVHAEAENIEHVISEDLEERIANFLGNPRLDPHGDPIPTKAGIVTAAAQQRLGELEQGASAVICRVSDQRPEHLRYFSALGLTPGATVDVVRREPFNGPLLIRVNAGQEHVLDENLAEGIWVRAAGREPFERAVHARRANPEQSKLERRRA